MITDSAERLTRVLVVCPWFFFGDAVGAAARDTYIHLKSRANLDVSAIWMVNDYDDVEGVQAPTVSALLLEPSFLAADVLIYVFAVYHPYFDAILLGNGHAAQVVRFHNVTPKKFMPEKHWAVIERSFVQIQNFSDATEIWADSQENHEELLRQGISGRHVRIEPLAVECPVKADLANKQRDSINLLYVGRFFESKGVIEVIEAVALLRDRTTIPFKLRLVGNLRFSDEDYVARVAALIGALQLNDCVELVGTVSREDLASHYAMAHIYVTGSRHEGFCVPVIEGLAAGCVPVSYAISNLRFISGGLGALAAEDTPLALSDSLLSIIDALYGQEQDRVLPLDRGAVSVRRFDLEARRYVETFSPEAFSKRIGERVTLLAREG